MKHLTFHSRPWQTKVKNDLMNLTYCLSWVQSPAKYEILVSCSVSIVFVFFSTRMADWDPYFKARKNKSKNLIGSQYSQYFRRTTSTMRRPNCLMVTIKTSPATDQGLTEVNNTWFTHSAPPPQVTDFAVYIRRNKVLSCVSADFYSCSQSNSSNSLSLIQPVKHHVMLTLSSLMVT